MKLEVQGGKGKYIPGRPNDKIDKLVNHLELNNSRSHFQLKKFIFHPWHKQLPYFSLYTWNLRSWGNFSELSFINWLSCFCPQIVLHRRSESCNYLSLECNSSKTIPLKETAESKSCNKHNHYWYKWMPKSSNFINHFSFYNHESCTAEPLFYPNNKREGYITSKNPE